MYSQLIKQRPAAHTDQGNVTYIFDFNFIFRSITTVSGYITGISMIHGALNLNNNRLIATAAITKRLMNAGTAGDCDHISPLTSGSAAILSGEACRSQSG